MDSVCYIYGLAQFDLPYRSLDETIYYNLARDTTFVTFQRWKSQLDKLTFFMQL